MTTPDEWLPPAVGRLPEIGGRVLRLPLSAQIADALRRQIVAGELTAGTHVVQEEWCGRFGTSRMPVRDALRQLVHEGLLVDLGTGRVEVATLDSDDYGDAYELAALLHGWAARRVAETGTDEQLEELVRLHERALDSADDAQFAALSWELRRAINAYAASPRLLSMFDLLQRTAPRMARQSVPGMAEAARVANGAIMEAMVARDGARTEDLVRGYVREALRTVLHTGAAVEPDDADEAVC